jgi:hypothetical protein
MCGHRLAAFAAGESIHALTLASNDSSTFLKATLTELLFLNIEGMKVVIISEFGPSWHIFKCIESNAIYSINRPFLHFTIRVTAVVDESSLISHAVTVNHHPTIQVQTVVITVIVILLNHSVSELLFADNLP